MDGIDLGLFDFDRHNTLYFFVLNAEEQIYLRYGGRDAEDPLTYMDLDSLALALEQGLLLHQAYLDGRLPRSPRPAPFFPEQIEDLKRHEIDRGRCVECHLIADYQAQELQTRGHFDALAKLKTMYASPDIKTLGVHLDVPAGLRVERAEGAAARSGMQAGDRIVAVEGTRVYTFGDLQYRYDQVPRVQPRLALEVERAGARQVLDVELPPEWWRTDLLFRNWSIEPRLHFSADPLDAEQKRALELAPGGFACRVRFVEAVATARALHQLVPGDVIYAVDGIEQSPLTTDCEVYLKLAHRAGSAVRLGVIRGAERLEMALRSERQFFRKQEREGTEP